MKRFVLPAYQIVTGLSDTSTGLLLLFAPGLTLRLMKVDAGAEALPFLSYVGVFVLSVGIACLYGASLIKTPEKLEVVWLLTGITRGLVALFVIASIVSGTLEPGWSTVACTDGVLSVLQFIGLATGWLRRVQA